MHTFHFDRAWTFAVPADELFSVLDRTDDFRRWWTWLRHFDTTSPSSSAAALSAGVQANCLIQGPVPYALRLQVEIERVERPTLVETHVRGDLDGPARLEVQPTPAGSTARLSWELELRDATLRRINRFARPLMEWAHDRVVGMGVEQFRRHALAGDVSRVSET
ncbi:MAG: Polyketide cyclase / dehydrase and lipid transport [Actinomycetia bacterium]|nr:Polyketide cyclase / dehydrase and lipid transport [Actinomycetes bacterium]